MTDALGVIGDGGLPLRSNSHFNPDENWVVLMAGEEVRRPKNLRRVAITRAEMTFAGDADLERFLEILKDSDERLRAVPDDEVMYEWQIVRRRDLTIRFGVAWYDEDFFASRRDAYLSPLHEQVFARFNVKPSSVRIEHIPL